MKLLTVLIYSLVFGLYISLLFFAKEIFRDLKETCKLLFNFKGEGEDDY